MLCIRAVRWFSLFLLQETPEPFYTLAREIYPGRYFPTKTHYFIKLLHDKGLLLRNFTQNIDTLERLTGLDEERIIEAHGSFATASCIECNTAADTIELKKMVLQAKVARCVKCKKGLIKPDIVFFGENLPKRFFSELDASAMKFLGEQSIDTDIHIYTGIRRGRPYDCDRHQSSSAALCLVNRPRRRPRTTLIDQQRNRGCRKLSKIGCMLDALTVN